MIRIGNGQGFWGDWLEAPVRLVEGGPIDYLALDYLAEVTMSILQKQRKQNPDLGYAQDFPPLIGRIAGRVRQKNIKVVANAGGVNPVACAQAVRRHAPELKVAVVLGDDLLDRVPDMVQRGIELTNIDTGDGLAPVLPKVLSANAYIGAFPLAEALGTGADVVITGRCADAALALAPMIHEFGWQPDELDRLAGGTVAGHIIECGAQCTGGNRQVNWESVPDLANIGYPILEASPDGSSVVTKHPGTGGIVDVPGIKEQLVYEIGDPRSYMTPDVVADFTSVTLQQQGTDRVQISGAKGRKRPDMLKVSISYAWGWKAVGTLVYSWPGAVEKALAAERIVRERLEQLQLPFEAIHTELFGRNACHGTVAAPVHEPPEIQLRIGVRGPDRKAVDRFTREVIPLVLSGPPTGTGYGDGRPPVREVVAYWPALVPRTEVETRVQVFE